MGKHPLIFLLIILYGISGFFIFNADAQAGKKDNPVQKRKIRVGVNIIEPMAMKKGDEYVGWTIDWLKAIGSHLNWDFEYVESESVSDVFEKLKRKEIDIGLGGIMQSEERERQADLSHNFFKSGYRILLRSDFEEGKHDSSLGFIVQVFQFNGLRAFLNSVKSPMFLDLLITYLLCVLFFAHVVYFSERGTSKLNVAGDINDQYTKGIFEAIYFCIVTSSSTGYGDFTARRIAGRVSACFLIVLGIALFANLTAMLSSDYTTEKMEAGISSIKDLRGKTVATVENTAAVNMLNEVDAQVIRVKKATLAFDKLMNNKVDAVVADNPSVLYFAKSKGKGKVKVVGEMFRSRYYCFALQNNSPLQEDISQMLFRLFAQMEHERLKKKWFGTY